MITHYDMSTGAVIGQDSRDCRDDAQFTEAPTTQARLMTVDEAARVERSQQAPAAVVMNALNCLPND